MKKREIEMINDNMTLQQWKDIHDNLVLQRDVLEDAGMDPNKQMDAEITRIAKYIKYLRRTNKMRLKSERIEDYKERIAYQYTRIQRIIDGELNDAAINRYNTIMVKISELRKKADNIRFNSPELGVYSVPSKGASPVYVNGKRV